MAKTYKHTFFMQLGNALATTLVRAGIKMGPIHLLTVRGRKSCQPRTTPVAVVEQNGQRYLIAPYGVVNWVRNLRSAGEATLTCGRHHETIRVSELSPEEAAPVLKKSIAGRSTAGFIREYFNVSSESPLEDFVREAPRHPVFRITV
ncbi:nitroreductase family deazaflavin-dependent oxidoreductase [Ktedonosporobacter rubrisoli]|uniref:Nitroreductase family deazaflavin-dependent oxidoreductase n=1 Tax=Ktedonosporobacter rubrisoli TaxID=2509675 RepID=A0A4P6JKY2_KTERU|nr:nitroreductase family deazaflavin-dependent oxidoreductase [Ktedonosporobacter rubrisoli]QBD75839.1 nitroreductase family deazaflavin-dependent oxidoreductase [Ktedonosporobacter rubrisoli]